MTKKQTLRLILFTGLLAAMILGLSLLFSFKDLQLTSRFKNWRSLEKNTVDVVIVGTSGMDRYMIGPKAYEEYGITMFPLSSDAQSAWLMQHVLEEAKKTQDFKLAIIDMRPFTMEYEGRMEKADSGSRRILDRLDFLSLNRLKAVKKTVEEMKMNYPEAEHSVLSYYLPFVKFHSRWTEEGYLLDEDDEQYQDYLGFFTRRTVSTKGMSGFNETLATDVRRELHPTCERALYELLEYLDKQDYEVLFLDTPHYHNEGEKEKMNTLCDILDEKGYQYKTYDVEDGTFNLLAEFYNDGHVNYYGAQRFTDLFIPYLKENYEFPDRREDPACVEDWSGAYDSIQALMDSWSLFKKMQRPVITLEAAAEGVQINWQLEDITEGYQILRNTTEGGRYELLQEVSKGETGTYIDTTAVAGQTYYYMIRAYRTANGVVEYSSYSPAEVITAGVQ